jgi:hypothetical protein
MKIIISTVVSALIVLGLMILQLRSWKRYHPNAEMLIRFLKLIGSETTKKDQNL